MRGVAAVTLVTVGLLSPALAQSGPPTTPRRAVIDRYPGLTVVDSLRWMEAPRSPELSRWLAAQDRHTTLTLAGLPGRDSLFATIRALARHDDSPRRVRTGGDRVFFLRQLTADRAPSWRVYHRSSAVERSLVVSAPINRLDPAPGGRLVALSLPGDRLHVSDVDGDLIVDSVVGARFAGWAADGGSVYYQRGRALYRQRVGSSLGSGRVVARSGMAGAPVWSSGDALIVRSAARSGDELVIVTRDDVWRSVHLRRPESDRVGSWTRVAVPADSIVDAVIGDRIYLLSRRGAPRGLVLSPRPAMPSRRDTVVRGSDRVLGSLALASDGVYLIETTGGIGGVRRIDPATGDVGEIAFPIDGTLRTGHADAAEPGVLVGIDRWLGVTGWYRLTAERVERLALTPDRPQDDGRFVVRRHGVRSADGSLVPLTVIHRGDLVLDGSHPVWLLAYGAYGIAMTPLYQSLGPALRMFLDRGGVYAVAHVRGGGEFGREWHDAGRQGNKPNGYRDLIAGAEWLVANGYGRSDRLAIEGASGGGATVGMAAVTRPDLFRVVLTHVPDANTLRLHATPDGPYMVDEWGDIRTRRGAAALAAMDVTRHVRSGGVYPAWFLTTGLLDESVPPWMPAKLAAQLQAAAGGQRPVLLRVHPNDGHVPGPSTALEQLADIMSFFFWQIGDPAFQPVPS